MSLPGLGLLSAPNASSVAAPIAGASTALHRLDANCEWRFEVASGSQIEVKILTGTAEIFGTELALNHVYTFRGTKAAIFTWHGCKIEVTGQCEEYMAEETPMTTYVNTHFALDKLRHKAAETKSEGPRVLVVGPTDAGKTSLVKLLTAYATRTGWQPMVVNTDTREGMLSVPGSLTATVFSSTIDVEEGWGSSPTSGPSPLPVKLPLCYYYGLPSAEDNAKLLKPVLTRLALAATSRLADDEEVKSSGMIIDTSGVVSQGKGGYDLLSHIISEFSVDIILTLGSERLHSDMLRRFSSPITVVKLPKSGGCVDRDETFMSLFRQAQIREYFFGDPRRTLSPQTQQVDFSSISCFKVRESEDTTSFGAADDDYDPAALTLSSQTQIFDKVNPSTAMLHSLLAVMHASPKDPQDAIRDASVMGFVYVADVDEKRKKVKLLQPLSGRVGEWALVWGSWPEPVMTLL